MGEHPIYRIHELLQQEQEELLGDAAGVHSFLSVEDDLRGEAHADAGESEGGAGGVRGRFSRGAVITLTFSGFLRSTSEYMVSSRSVSLTKWPLRTCSTR